MSGIEPTSVGRRRWTSEEQIVDRRLIGVLGRRGQIGIVIVLLATGAAGLWLAVGHDGAGLNVLRLPAWALTIMFGLAEVFVLHIQVRREAQTVSLSEIPLVVGLFYASPTNLLLGRLIGPLLVFIVHRRQRSVTKIAFNVALFAADLMAAVAVFHLLLGKVGVLGPRAWVATYAALAVFGFLDAIALTTVIGLSEGRIRFREVCREVVASTSMSLATGTVALVGVSSLAQDRLTIWLLAGTALMLTGGYRAYARLYERHLSLERLYRFSQVVSGSSGLDAVLSHVVAEAQVLLRSEHAGIVFLPLPDMAVVAETGPDGSFTVRRSAVGTEKMGLDLVAESDAPVLAARRTRDPRLRRYLRRSGYREAILVPLHDESGLLGIVTVADRMAEVRTFDCADVRLLETVANHATIALQNGRLIDRLRHDALHDSLTGLPNRTFFQHRLSEVIDRLESRDIRCAAAMIMDLNGFKEVNDTLGHHHGDALLVEVAKRLVCAAGDIATVARLGGDEFAVLLPDIAGPAPAQEVGQAIIAALNTPFVVGEMELSVRASLGISLAPQFAATASGLLKQADVAMYSAKSAGGGARFYEAALDTNTLDRLALQADLAHAIQLRDLRIDIQPKASMSDRSIIGAEALARWHHPLRGDVPPEDFVAVAERTGLIQPLTLSVLDLALAACASWHGRGYDLGIAVNLSARSLVDLGLVDDLSALLSRHQVPASRLTLELTESSIMTEPARTMSVLARLHDMGIHISVDDFGTGYSSLSYLKRLPVDEMKIDRSFVTEMLTDPDSKAIVRSIVDLARNLSLTVIAEGVEDSETWQELADMGCGQAQGYHLCPPLPVWQFEQWLDGRFENHPTGAVQRQPTNPDHNERRAPVDEFTRNKVIEAETAGDICTVAGNRSSGHSGDGRKATRADLNSPQGLSVDGQGNLIVADTANNRVRAIAAATGTFYGQSMTAGDIYTVAGNGTGGYGGDGGKATRAELNSPQGLAVDRRGNLIVADTANNRVRVVAAATGTFYGQSMTAGDIYTVAGNGTNGCCGDGRKATIAEVSSPQRLAVDTHGNLIIADTQNSRIRAVAVSTGYFYGQSMTAGDIYTLAGVGGSNPGGCGPATSAVLQQPSGVGMDISGDLVNADSLHRMLGVLAASKATRAGWLVRWPRWFSFVRTGLGP